MKRAIDLIWPQYREPAKCGFRLLRLSQSHHCERLVQPLIGTGGAAVSGSPEALFGQERLTGGSEMIAQKKIGDDVGRNAIGKAAQERLRPRDVASAKLARQVGKR